jgi:SAM-dependent methyltransferase
MMNPAEFANIAAAERDFWWYRGMRRIMFRLLDPFAANRRVERALDAGCGTGHFANVLAERYGWPMFPTDLASEALAHARRMGIARATQANIAALPFPSHSFDVVLSMDVLVHFPRGEEDQPMAELARVLRSGGLLALRVSALDGLRSRHSQFAHERQRFTRTRMAKLAGRHGIRILRLTYANSLLLPVALAKFRLVEPLLSGPPQSGVQMVAGWLDRLLYAPLAIESAWLGAGGALPLGQSLILLGEKNLKK